MFTSYKGYHYSKDKKLYNGTVKYRFENKLENTKTNQIYDIERNFIVKFDSLIDPVEIKVDNDTYFSYKKDDRVSFRMSRSSLNTMSSHLMVLISLSFIFFIGNIVFLVMYIVSGVEHFSKNYTLSWISTKKNRIRKSVDPYGEETWDD